MNPPFGSSSLTPILSPISAQFDSPLETSSRSLPTTSAVRTLGKCSQQSSSTNPSSRNATAFGAASLRAFRWSKLVSAGLEDKFKMTSSTLQHSDIYDITPPPSTAQPSLLSAMSVESLPHYSTTGAADERLEDPTTARPGSSQMSRALDAMAHLSSMPPPIPPKLPLDSPGASERHEQQHRPVHAHTKSAPLVPRVIEERIDSPSPMIYLELDNGRRKLSLSTPKDKMNSAALLHRRPATGKNAADIFHGPVSCEQSGFANPGVEAAEERWKKQVDGDISAFGLGPSIMSGASDPNPKSAEASSPVFSFRTAPWPASPTKLTEQSDTVAAHADTTAKLNITPPRKLPLSNPHNTQDSSPILHNRPKRFQNAAGVHVDWISRERSGFANPTQAASRERWTTLDERESRGRWNGLPSTNSWDMNKTHVFGSTNCFDSIENGFGMGGKRMGSVFSGTDQGNDISTGLATIDTSGSRTEIKNDRAPLTWPRLAAMDSALPRTPGGSVLRRAEADIQEPLDRTMYAPQPVRKNSGLVSEAPGTIHQSQGGIRAAIGSNVKDDISVKDPAATTSSVPPPGDGIEPYPVPAGLVAAASGRTSREGTKAKTRTAPSPARLFAPHRRSDSGSARLGNVSGLQSYSMPRSAGFGESGVTTERQERRDENTSLGLGSHEVRRSSEASGSKGTKAELKLDNNDFAKQLQEWRDNDRLRWTKSSVFEARDKGLKGVKASPKHPAAYYLQLGAAARDMNKAISPIVDSGGFEEDLSSAWLLTSGLKVHGATNHGTPEKSPRRRNPKKEDDDELALVNVSPIEYAHEPESLDEAKRRLLQWNEETIEKLKDLPQAIKVQVATNPAPKNELEEAKRWHRHAGLALVNISPVDSPNHSYAEREAERRLLEWNAETARHLKDIPREVRSPPPQKGVVRGQRGESPAEERRRRRRMERRESATTSTQGTPAPSAEMVQGEWQKKASP